MRKFGLPEAVVSIVFWGVIIWGLFAGWAWYVVGAVVVGLAVAYPLVGLMVGLGSLFGRRDRPYRDDNDWQQP